MHLKIRRSLSQLGDNHRMTTKTKAPKELNVLPNKSTCHPMTCGNKGAFPRNKLRGALFTDLKSFMKSNRDLYRLL